ncbi:hypothetical protein ABZ370_37820 [Streptomyces sp. NPDC005962]|uniref:hypothetical protein n=1 Tax=Streptomyces sp. NPDC005962 TaxID=3154466 RepID=UPI0033DB59B3
MDKTFSFARECSAEVEQVWPRDGHVTLRFALVGAEARQATVVLRVRGEDGGELRLPADSTGQGYEVRIPLRLLAARRTADEWYWDLYLDVGAGGEPLRLGTHLDDITGKKKIFVYPAQHTAGFRAAPYYTIKDNLSIRCRREEGQ